MTSPSSGNRLARVVACLLLAGSTFSSAIATDAKVLAEAKDQLKDYVHYVRIARYDLAKSYGQSLLDKMGAPFGKVEGDAAIDGAEFAKLVDESGEMNRFEDSASRGMRIADLESISAQLLRAYDLGKKTSARSATSIDSSITLLTGGQRQRLVARERLAEAGEFAMPQLLAALSNQTNPSQRAEVRQLMVDMGRQAARPLQTAIAKLDPSAQEAAAGVLGDIPMTSSIPYLYEVLLASNNDGVRRACTTAINKLTGGGFEGNPDLAAKFRTVADQYAAGADSLIPFPKEETQTVWSFDPAAGLTGTPVNTKVFGETMAMLTAERALKANPADREALASWIAADFSREIKTPAGYEHPLFKDRPSAMYYASAAGSDVLSSVLNRALATGNVQLARKAISALASTTGPAQMSKQGATPALVSALRFPNRRVQTDAALALATTSGGASFDSAERVVPILASAVRDAGVKTAVVVSSDAERANAIGQTLRSAGFTVLPAAGGLAEAEAAASSTAGVDLFVTALGPAASSETIKGLRAGGRFAGTPVLAFTDAEGMMDLGRQFDRDVFVRIARSGIDSAATTEAVKQLIEGSSGPMLTADEVTAYQAKALAALRDVAISGSPSMSIADAAAPLVAALEASKNGKAEIAGVLGLINDPRAQRALVETALKSEGDTMTALINAAATSAKRFGNLLTESQVRSLSEIAAKPTAPGATAVSGLLGALNVSGDRIVPMILGTK